jgi:hypothetical protein
MAHHNRNVTHGKPQRASKQLLPVILRPARHERCILLVEARLAIISIRSILKALRAFRSIVP